MIEWLNSSSGKEHLVVKMTLVGNAGSLAPTHSTMESSKKCSCVVVSPPVLWLLPRQHPISRLSQVLQFLLTWLYNFLSGNSFPTKIIITSCNYWTIESHAIIICLKILGFPSTHVSLLSICQVTDDHFQGFFCPSHIHTNCTLSWQFWTVALDVALVYF